MSTASLLRHLHFRWQEIARRFWPDTPRQNAATALARLDAELERRQRRLLLLRRRIEKLQQALERREDRRELLAAQMHETPVDAGAVEKWERRGQTSDRLRERLQEREHEYVCRLTRLRRRKQQRAELRERLLSALLPKPAADENDLDYPF